jgi:glycosyltransferase involved in cell wall biosynthesis
MKPATPVIKTFRFCGNIFSWLVGMDRFYRNVVNCMGKQKRILLFNFVLDDNYPVLAHQTDVVRILARHFSEVVVISGRIGGAKLPPNVTAFSTDWQSRRFFHNIFFFLRALCRVKVWRNFEIVFFHMVVYQLILSLPFLFFSKAKKILWYAHKQDSFALRLACSQIDTLISSTQGSFPFKSPKLKVIGQMVDSQKFRMFEGRDYSKLCNFVHIGRLDSSKQVDKIIDSLASYKQLFPRMEFTSYGEPSNAREQNWSLSVLDKYASNPEFDWVRFLPSIPKREVPTYLSSADVFIHAFQGSLDKTLIEATLSGIPVVTTNKEYVSFFGSWTGVSDPNLFDEIQALMDLDSYAIEARSFRNREIAKKHHSIQSWERRILPIFGVNE